MPTALGLRPYIGEIPAHRIQKRLISTRALLRRLEISPRAISAEARRRVLPDDMGDCPRMIGMASSSGNIYDGLSCFRSDAGLQLHC